MTNNTPSILVDHLMKRFGAFTAVNDVTFDVQSGEIMGFLGPNGAGKSTLIRMLCGLLRPSGGRGQVAGFDVMLDPERVRENIGYMSQKFSLYADLSALENLRFFGGVYGVKGERLKTSIDFAVEMAGLAGRTDALVSTLSGGWKQRLALGCAILHQPAVLFLDEPTSGVDPISRRRFWDLIYALAAGGVSVLVTTHYMDEAGYCDRVALIDRGRLVALGTPGELKDSAIQGEMLLVECRDLWEALSMLERTPGVREVAPFGSALHVTVDNADTVIPLIYRTLDLSKLGIQRIERIEPTLEDVFVQLVGTKPADGASQQ
jgi:ABC-2 type transport system ATP-binding protein